MKGLRNKAAEGFKTLASGSIRPAALDPTKGGLSTRYAAVFTGEIARNLNQWFDPFDVGVAKDGCKLILVRLFQDEAQALCDAMDTTPRMACKSPQIRPMVHRSPIAGH
jgi:hypothetical protein